VVILVVEDEAIVALLLEMALSLAGHRVLGPVATAEEALETAQEMPPELALIDIRLLGSHDGIWLARNLRDRWGVPALFLSGQTTQARRPRRSTGRDRQALQSGRGGRGGGHGG
jgi:DNA-binding response OmpR family regulator